MYLESVNKICDDVFNGKPTEIIRNTVGLAGYVYTVVLPGRISVDIRM